MSTYPDLANKVALVTGASSGIGYFTALRLARDGVRLGIHYRSNRKVAEELVEEIRAAGGTAVALGADMLNTTAIEHLVAGVVSHLGPVDILVNNAGSLVERRKILELEESIWDEVLDLNLKSAFLASRAVARSMMERRSGVIINMSSIAARNGGGPGAIAYATAKGGLSTFTKALAREMAAYGVRVNAVAPGVISTPFHERHSTKEMLENFAKNTPLGRVGRSEEIAEAVAWLASSCSSYVVGETLEVNGGLLMD